MPTMDGNHEMVFYDLANLAQSPVRVPGRYSAGKLSISPDGEIVASPTTGGSIEFYDPVKGQRIASLRVDLAVPSTVAFSPDRDRVMTTRRGQDTVKIWDLSTQQELLTLSGIASSLSGLIWTGDGNVVLAGPPWQAWSAPSWDEIAATEANEGPLVPAVR
jgi:WD40 repeat protein